MRAAGGRNLGQWRFSEDKAVFHFSDSVMKPVQRVTETREKNIRWSQKRKGGRWQSGVMKTQISCVTETFLLSCPGSEAFANEVLHEDTEHRKVDFICSSGVTSAKHIQFTWCTLGGHDKRAPALIVTTGNFPSRAQIQFTQLIGLIPHRCVCVCACTWQMFHWPCSRSWSMSHF